MLNLKSLYFEYKKSTFILLAINIFAKDYEREREKKENNFDIFGYVE